MTKTLKFLAALLLAFPVFAQAQGADFQSRSQPELDQMLAPIALYPDALLSQVLMAATYPREVEEAARWSRANPGLQGDDAVHAVQYEAWDPSVKSLVAFPQLLARMAENPAWTWSLGDAFLMQEPQVMDTVQQLRLRARAAGQLASDERLLVVEQSSFIRIQPANPHYIYVPYYDPRVVYGSWWWPSYQPVVWDPWPGYARHRRPGLPSGFWWGTPVGLSLNFFFGNFDWHSRYVRVVHPTAYYYRAPVTPNRTVVVAPQRWQHEARQREAVAERRAMQVPQQTEFQARIQRPEHRNVAVPALQERREVRRADSQPAQAKIQAQPQPAAQPRVERRARMPDAVVSQQPRAEQRKELRNPGQERRHERGPKGNERS